MIKAVVTKGVIVPRDPLPEEWQEGTEVAVEILSADVAVAKDIPPADAWMDEVEAITRHGNQDDYARLDAEIPTNSPAREGIGSNQAWLESLRGYLLDTTFWNACSWATRQSCKRFWKQLGSGFEREKVFPMKLSGKKSRRRTPPKAKSEAVCEKVADKPAEFHRSRYPVFSRWSGFGGFG